MKPFLLIYLLFLVSGSFWAQNLIQNPSFEEHGNCAASFVLLEDLNGWAGLGQTTPDFYCQEHIDEFYRIPQNRWGYQPARTGGAYSAIVVYKMGTPSSRWNEYLVSTLESELQKDSLYYFEMHVSLANRSAFAVDRLGVTFQGTLLEDTLVQPYSFTYISGPPHVESARGELLGDTLGWMKINGLYRARGGEQYAIIGNFRKEGEVASERVNEIGILAYYYVDDVALYPFSLNLPDSVVLCPGEEIWLDASISPVFQPVTYRWSNGQNSPAISVSEAGYTSVEVSFNDFTLNKGVQVIVLPEAAILGADTAICENSQVVLDAGAGFDQYQWQDGQPGQTYLAEQAGFYEVTVTNRCGVFSAGLLLETEKCDCSVFVPNAFSPNGDGINDIFIPNFSCGLVEPQNYSLQIFDRWGAMVFESKAVDIGWQGSQRSLLANRGLYVWRMSYEYVRYDGTRTIEELSGELTLIR